METVVIYLVFSSAQIRYHFSNSSTVPKVKWLQYAGKVGKYISY